MAGTPYAFFKGEFMPLAEAKIGIMTHAFNYGTAVFEGIRANWNSDQQQLYLFRALEHFQRLRKSAHILMMKIDYADEQLVAITHELLRKAAFREDMYVRPMVYKSQEVLGVRLHDVEQDLLIYTAPFGAYLDIDKGIRCCTSSWRRAEDTAIPVRAKVNGVYVNSALAKTEAFQRGYEEAILLNEDGHVSEGSGENIFLVMNGKLYTPPSADNILVGITRAAVIELARAEIGLEVLESPIDRSELYVADELFMTGTAAHVTPVLEVDGRVIGSGGIGPVTAKLQELYFGAALGRLPQYERWIQPLYTDQPVRA